MGSYGFNAPPYYRFDPMERLDINVIWPIFDALSCVNKTEEFLCNSFHLFGFEGLHIINRHFMLQCLCHSVTKVTYFPACHMFA